MLGTWIVVHSFELLLFLFCQCSLSLFGNMDRYFVLSVNGHEVKSTHLLLFCVSV
eukprot:m.12216 g.12216  ORF g.12216 m.12216 type:complete len:55 (+) comp7139_c0_seq2:1743-1907(+)